VCPLLEKRILLSAYLFHYLSYVGNIIRDLLRFLALIRGLDGAFQNEHAILGIETNMLFI